MKKSAILFGINEYKNGEKLRNAANDAYALAEKLNTLGFETKCFVDVDSETMHRELTSFKNDLEQSSVGLFFFAGHGIQCKGENYLATMDESSCKYSAIPLNLVIDYFEESKVSTKIIILDACRNNPFVTWRSVANDGLAPVYAPKGTIVAFSTSPGQKASDGKNDHGVYTQALLAHIATKNLSIEDMFKRVRNTVSSYTGHKQITWEHTSLMGTFYFNSGIDSGEAKPTYSAEALADQEYELDDSIAIHSIISTLKTYNWYKQNPAIARIKTINFSSADKDDLFVLGRNIYQAACGGSGSAYDWIDGIEANLNRIGGSSAIHLLNGILFEIFFNCGGKIRTKIKSDCYEKPVKLCQQEKYASSASFIRSYLEQYPQQILHIPGSQDILTIDILVSEKNARYIVDGICIDGLSCMYNQEATDFYAYDRHAFCSEMTLDDVATNILFKIAAPKNRVKFTYNMNLGKDVSVVFPFDFNLLRYI